MRYRHDRPAPLEPDDEAYSTPWPLVPPAAYADLLDTAFLASLDARAAADPDGTWDEVKEYTARLRERMLSLNNGVPLFYLAHYWYRLWEPVSAALGVLELESDEQSPFWDPRLG